MPTRRHLLQTTAGLLVTTLPLWPTRAGASGAADPPGPVSYTHLTLPPSDLV